MRAKDKPPARVLRAVHGTRDIHPDPEHEIALSEHLRTTYDRDRLVDLYSRFAIGDGSFETMMRRVIWRSSAKRFGNGVTIGSGVGFLHLETFEIGDGVFIGAHSYLQGRCDGHLILGARVWLGPQAYLDGRDLVLEDYVGWGPGDRKSTRLN